MIQSQGGEQIREGLAYIRSNPVVRDVLLSGGDPLMLSDDYLDWILTELRKIEHVQVIRIGTRMRWCSLTGLPMNWLPC